MEEQRIKELIRQEIQNVAFTAVNDDDALLDQNILDSVGAVDLAVALEGAFGISIPFVDINKQHFHSVDTLAAYVRIKTR
jgi:D-alanine--poly(phosphoribitol) ligase subunit 2